MPVRNKGPDLRGFQRRIAKVEPDYPQRAESKIRAIENRRLKELQKVVRESMPEILKIVAEEQSGSDGIRQDGYSDMVRRIRNRFRIMRDLFNRRLKADPLERDVKWCADYTDRRQLEAWQRSVRATLGIDIRADFFLGKEYDRMLSKWAKQNVSFITSIEQDCFDEMEAVIVEGFTKGRTPAAISSEIQNRFDVTKSKANLLARDQIGTLNADLTRARQESAGVKEYVWSSSGDERVRECHRELDGKTFRYDDPPAMWYMTKHGKVYSGRHCNPGEDYQCRCVAKPVFDFEKLNREAFKEKK